jgi:hypothetical protein
VAAVWVSSMRITCYDFLRLTAIYLHGAGTLLATKSRGLFKKPEGSILCLQEPATWTYSEPEETSPHLHTLLHCTNATLLFPPVGLFLSDFHNPSYLFLKSLPSRLDIGNSIWRMVQITGADAGGRAVKGVDLRPLACWGCGCKSRRKHGRLFLVSVVWRQAEVSAMGPSLVNRSPSECRVSECDRRTS